jgi:site-specific DNA-methyltransferase (cytosine-N4-specific)
MLTDQGDHVLDPFAGSCITGEVAERLNRLWTCCELLEDYVKAASYRFPIIDQKQQAEDSDRAAARSYTLFRPGSLWADNTKDKLSRDGGKGYRRVPEAKKDTVEE